MGGGLTPLGFHGDFNVDMADGRTVILDLPAIYRYGDIVGIWSDLQPPTLYLTNKVVG